MRYGFCTGFATTPRFSHDEALLRRINEAGYDYPDFPIMTLASLDEKTFKETVRLTEERTCTTACNLFPALIRLVGKEVSGSEIRAYLVPVLSRLARLGTKHLVLGSAVSRMCPQGTTVEKAKVQFGETLVNHILPPVHSFGMDVLLEPLNRTECNLLNTVAECAAFVEEIGDPSLSLMVDIYHMMTNGEDPKDIKKAYSLIKHVHVAERDRALPGNSFSPYVQECLDILLAQGYDQTVSYETVDGDITKACKLLKRTFRQ